MNLGKLKSVINSRNDDPFDKDDKRISFDEVMDSHIDAILDLLTRLEDGREFVSDALGAIKTIECPWPCDSYGTCQRCGAEGNILLFKSTVYGLLDRLYKI